jgi:hypothetical protein
VVKGPFSVSKENDMLKALAWLTGILAGFWLGIAAVTLLFAAWWIAPVLLATGWAGYGLYRLAKATAKKLPLLALPVTALVSILLMAFIAALFAK